jgi:hypothetical protein
MPELTDSGTGWERTFLTRPEAMELTLWLVQHLRECRSQADIVLASTDESGIGSNLVVRCCACDTSKDITDYRAW